jgi:hypothetical protein
MISKVCQSYFNAPKEISNFKKNDKTTNSLAALKIASYFTVVIPLGFATVYGASALYNRVNGDNRLSSKVSTLVNKIKNVFCKKPKNEINKTIPHTEINQGIENLRKKASKFIYEKRNAFEFSLKQYTENDLNELNKYINKTLDNAEFQADPKQFVQIWKFDIGKETSQPNFVEDSAFEFFNVNVLAS